MSMAAGAQAAANIPGVSPMLIETIVCTANLSSGVVLVKSAEDGV
jgi:hypothetical protein